MQNPEQVLRRLFDAAVNACTPARVVPSALPPRPPGRIVVVGAGKAAAAMAAAVEAAWGAPISGHVVTRYGHGALTQHIEVIEAGHPLPDPAGLVAAARALETAQELGAGDFLLVLLSGGGSALWSAPLAPVSLAEKQDITRALVLSGATIGEINCVRKHLSAIKGGRLAAAAFPARVLALAISDVAGDDGSTIASGPTVGDASTHAQALAILRRYQIAVPDAALRVLTASGTETVKPCDPRLARSEFHVIARAADAIAAACDEAHRLGLETRVLGVNVEGEARQVALAHAEIARHQTRSQRPLVLLSGGELTLKVEGPGRGGPNREYLLALAQSLHGAEGIWALSADTDGIDGSDGVAGGWISPDTLLLARQRGLDPASYARNNDSGGFFELVEQQIVTGPTLTNVNDFRAILLMPDV